MIYTIDTSNPGDAPADLVHAVRLLEAAEYRFAKTMPRHPHHYTLRRTWPAGDEFASAFNAIEKYAEDGWFYQTPRRYLKVNGQRYWTMTDDVDECTLINRAVDGPDYR